MIRFLLLSSLLPLLGAAPAASQERGLEGLKPADYAFSIADSRGTSLDHPLTGGFNASLFQFVDLDDDNDQDVFVQVDNERLLYFQNIGTPSRHEFRLAPLPFPRLPIGTWFCFADIDNDGRIDLLSDSGGFYIRLYRNAGSKKAPDFQPWMDKMKDASGNEIIIPISSFLEFADIDCDGDADMFTATQNGTIRFLENRTAKGGEPAFHFNTQAYAGLSFIKEPSPKAKAGALRKVAHGSRNTVSFADIDADGDLDLIWGDFFDAGLVRLVNEGTCKEPRFSNQSPIPGDGSLQTGGANLSRFADLDADGFPDLFVSVIGGAFAEPPDLVRGIHHFKNQTGSGTTDFRLVTGQLLPTFDIGRESNPAIADIDGDGRLDLLIGNQVDTSSFMRGKVYYYRNEGTPSQAAFVRVSSDFLPGDSLVNPAPTFSDIDKDGDMDLFVGNVSGTIRFYRNTGSPKSALFVMEDSVFQDIRVGRRSIPKFADMDHDGDEDLIVGEARGIIRYFANKGSATVPMFEGEESAFQDIELPMACAPAVGDINKDGLLDLVVGGVYTETLVFLNTGTSDVPSFRERLSLPSPPYFTPVLMDLDEDGDLDLLGGTFGGGLLYFEQEYPIRPMGIAPGRGKSRMRARKGLPRRGVGVAKFKVGETRKWSDILGRIESDPIRNTKGTGANDF